MSEVHTYALSLPSSPYGMCNSEEELNNYHKYQYEIIDWLFLIPSSYFISFVLLSF